MTGSEDGTVKIWHSTTYRLENTLNYGLERLWALGYLKGSNQCVLCLLHAPGVLCCSSVQPDLQQLSFSMAAAGACRVQAVSAEMPVMTGSMCTCWASCRSVSTLTWSALTMQKHVPSRHRLMCAAALLTHCVPVPAAAVWAWATTRARC